MYRLTDIKELNDCIPIPLTQNITYIRQEKNDFYTFYSACEYTKELVTNKTALQILKLCNSSNRVKDILKEMKKKYVEVADDILYKDICNTLLQFERIQLIKWKGGNPIMSIEPIKINKNYELTLASECDIRNITYFLNNFAPSDDYIFIKTDELVNENFQKEISIRYRLFSHSGEYFIIKDKCGNVVGMISFSLSGKARSPIVYLEYICVPAEIFEECLKHSKDILKKYCVKDITKIEVVCLSNDPSKMLIDASLIPAGFEIEAQLKDEFEKGVDLIIYSSFCH